MNKNAPSSSIQLIAIDLDGTLLDSRRELPAGAVEFFHAARRAGLLVSIVTGRNACSVNELASLLHLSGPHACSGGAFVCGNRGRPVYARHSFRMEDFRHAVAISRRWGLTLFVQGPKSILMENGERYIDLISQPFYPCPPQPCTDILEALRFKPLKITLYGEQPELAAALAEYQQDNGRFHITSAGEEDIELTCAGVNKGSALREISAVTAIPLQNIMAIGDSPNDLSMFLEAGLAVAVGNALPEVKQAAAFIAPSNDEGGVFWAIRNLALTKQPV